MDIMTIAYPESRITEPINTRALRTGMLCPKRTRRVIDYIESNIGSPITLSDLADVAALSPHHFSRSFRKTFGMSPVRYVWSRRVEVAKRLIIYSTLPLASIAFSCGFSSQSHFTTAFREATGMTPTKYSRSPQHEALQQETDA